MMTFRSERRDFVAVCERHGLDADAFEAAAADDVVAGRLTLPAAARYANSSEPPPAYWAWLISLMDGL